MVTPTEQLTAARTKKAKLQGWVTRVATDARAAITSGDKDQISGIRSNLKSKYEKYKDVCELLMDLLTAEEELSVLFNETAGFDSEIETLLFKLESCTSTIAAATNQGDGGRYSHQSSAFVKPCAKVKLPKLQLKSFSGNPILWPEFWDMYDAAIHSNQEIPAVQKFTHLKSLLTDEAAMCIASISTTDANYEVAIQRLQSRYGKQEMQRNRLMSKLTQMPDFENYGSLREGVDDLMATVRVFADTRG